MNEASEARVIVAGRVQGVYFRASVRETAARNGVNGFVRNLHDGSVEAVLQGDRDAVEKVVAFMREGPPGAVVRKIEVVWRTLTDRWDGFFIRH